MSVVEGRHTAAYDGDVVVFLIGMPLLGLGKVAGVVPVGTKGQTAAERLHTKG